MTAGRLGMWFAGTLALVGLVVLLDSSGVLSKDAATVVDDAAQLGAGLTATFVCLVTARRVRGAERRWRQFMVFGMAGWSIGQALWSYYQIFSDTPLPSPSWADVGYLMLPIGALPALLALAVAPQARPEE